MGLFQILSKSIFYFFFKQTKDGWVTDVIYSNMYPLGIEYRILSQFFTTSRKQYWMVLLYKKLLWNTIRVII